MKDAQTNKSARGNDSSDTESEDEKEEGDDDESKRRLESGGRDKVAYFFWQGEMADSNNRFCTTHCVK